MAIESIRLMFIDLSQDLLEKAKAAKVDALRSGSDYDKGRQFAYYEMISVFVQQADTFGIDRSAIGLNQVDPERDLLGS